MTNPKEFIPTAPIHTLIIDFGGVMVNLDIQLCIQNFKAIGVESIESLIGNFGQAGFFLNWEKGTIDLPTFRDEVRNISTQSPSDAEIDAAWCSFLQDIPLQRVELLKALRKKYRLVLLSNSNPLHIEVNARNEFGKHNSSLEELFDHCYISYQMGLTKPDPAIFNQLLTDEGTAPENCLFLDDGAKNIAVAQSMGIQSYLVTQGEPLTFLLEL